MTSDEYCVAWISATILKGFVAASGCLPAEKCNDRGVSFPKSMARGVRSGDEDQSLSGKASSRVGESRVSLHVHSPQDRGLC